MLGLQGMESQKPPEKDYTFKLANSKISKGLRLWEKFINVKHIFALPDKSIAIDYSSFHA